jgi:hypothetical protein
MYALFSHQRAVIGFCILACAVCFASGCSGRPKNVSKKVSGTVTVGGQPLPNAVVTFTPADGSPSIGRTDAEGKYNLVWSQQRGRAIEGAQIGEHTVTIRTFQFGDPTAKPPKPEIPEKVPLKYRQEGGFPKATVTAGANTIDFQLEAGPVDAPAPAKGKSKIKSKIK